MTDAAAAALVLLLLLAAARRGDLLAALPAEPQPPVDLGDGDAEQAQGGDVQEWAAALALLDVSPYMQPAPMPADEDAAARNVAAFLRMIRAAEGTAGPNGYRTLYGGRLFDSWADHPRIAQRFGGLWTTAAGAYQFMAVSPLPGGGATRVNTWDRLRDKLGLQDFGPASQDAAAVELIREAGALEDVRAGRLDAAIGKVRRIWASLPGAGYGQPERSRAELVTAYTQAGGTLA